MSFFPKTPWYLMHALWSWPMMTPGVAQYPPFSIATIWICRARKLWREPGFGTTIMNALVTSVVDVCELASKAMRHDSWSMPLVELGSSHATHLDNSDLSGARLPTVNTSLRFSNRSRVLWAETLVRIVSRNCCFKPTVISGRSKTPSCSACTPKGQSN